MEDFTPGPWTARMGELGHFKGSPMCDATCGAGLVPVRVEHDPKQEWHGEHEVHHMRENTVEGIYAADGSIVVEVGQDYDERGVISTKDARLIAAAPDLYAALMAILEIGKRDMSNPKYDGYFETAYAAISKVEAK